MNNCEWLVLRRSLEEALWLETAASLITLQGTGLETTGIVRCDQIQTLDLSVRNCQLIEKAPDYLIDEVLDRVISLFD